MLFLKLLTVYLKHNQISFRKTTLPYYYVGLGCRLLLAECGGIQHRAVLMLAIEKGRVALRPGYQP